MAEEEEKFDEEAYREKNKELLGKVEEILSKKKLCLMFNEGQGLKLSSSEIRKKLVELEDLDKKELKRIIDDAVASGDGADFGITEKGE